MSLFYNILGEESPLPPYLMMKPCCMYVYYCLHSSLYTYTYTCTCKLALYQTEIETYDSILEKLYFKNASLQRFDCLCMYYCWIILSCKCTAIHYTWRKGQLVSIVVFIAAEYSKYGYQLVPTESCSLEVENGLLSRWADVLEHVHIQSVGHREHVQGSTSDP